jgi:hypothetical protein
MKANQRPERVGFLKKSRYFHLYLVVFKQSIASKQFTLGNILCWSYNGIHFKNVL